MAIIGQNVSVLEALMSVQDPFNVAGPQSGITPFGPVGQAPPSPLAAAVNQQSAVGPGPAGEQYGPTQRPSFSQNPPYASRFLGGLPAALATLETPPVTNYPRSGLQEFLGGFGG